MRTFCRAGLPAILLVAVATRAHAQSTSGDISISGAESSGYVDIASGGTPTLTGNSGGGISGGHPTGGSLTGLSVNFGEVSPANGSSFVVATIPIRLRSNAAYTLTLTATAISNADTLAMQGSDIGFGLGTPTRTGTGVNAGSDSRVANTSGDPSLDPDQSTTTIRWNYKTNKQLSTYAAEKQVMSGPRIMDPTPKSSDGGVYVSAYFAIRPQYFTPGSVSSTITFTLTTP